MHVPVSMRGSETDREKINSCSCKWEKWIMQKRMKSQKRRDRGCWLRLIVSIKLLCQISKRLTTLDSFVKAHLSGAIIARGHPGT